jgi:hypothetical protein
LLDIFTNSFEGVKIKECEDICPTVEFKWNPNTNAKLKKSSFFTILKGLAELFDATLQTTVSSVCGRWTCKHLRALEFFFSVQDFSAATLQGKEIILKTGPTPKNANCAIFKFMRNLHFYLWNRT